MPERSTSEAQASRERVAAAATGRPAVAVEHPILQLARQAGNRAVTGLIQRETLTGNPQELKNSAGANTTIHGDVDIQDAANSPDKAKAGSERGKRWVEVVAPEASPVPISADVCPNPDIIYHESKTATAGYTEVRGLKGTVDAPMITQSANKSLYIDGKPQPGDVEQYGIGDCYGLSTIISIAARDPGKIQGMISADGNGGGSVTFWKRVPKATAPATGAVPTAQAEYQQTTVTATGQLAFELATPGGTAVAGNGRGGGQLHGAQLRAAQKPKETSYWAKIGGNQLEVHRNDVYEMARWAPVLEKAWARFAETHGQYGQQQRGPDRTGESTGGSGYAAIDGGWSHRVMTAFYGADAEPGGAGNVQQVATNFAPGANVVLTNTAAIDQLLLLQGRGDAAAPKDTTAPIITATAMTNQHIPRLSAAITAAMADPDWSNIKPRTKARIQNVQTKITAYNTAIAATYATQAAATTARQTAEAAVGDAAAKAVQPGETWSLLGRESRSAALTELMELLLDVRNAGTDHSTGQRNIYGNHVYSVVGFSVALTGGEAVPSPLPTGADRTAFYAKIDPVASKVKLQNPHHGNEPDQHGNNKPSNPSDGVPAGDGSDGVFSFTLTQFLRNFSSVESGVFTRS